MHPLLSSCQLPLYLCMPTAGFPLPSCVGVVVVRDGFSHHNSYLALCSKLTYRLSYSIQTYIQRTIMDQKEKHKVNRIPKAQNVKHYHFHSLYTCFLLPHFVCGFHGRYILAKYDIIPRQVTNTTVTLWIAYTAAVICFRASVNNLCFLFTCCWKMAAALFPNVLW